MEIEVLSKRENKLLNRLEVRFKVRFGTGGTPTKEDIREELARALKAKDKPIVIDGIRTEFGRREARGYAKVYESLDDARKIERGHILRRNKLAEAE